MSKTHSEIVQNWIGKRCDYDEAYGYQCVDWARQYCAEIGSPIGSFGGSAIACWNSGSAFGDSWERIVNTPSAVPLAGDIVFFSHGQYGHVAVVDEGCTNIVLKVIEQNGGKGKGQGEGVDAIRQHTYDYLKPPCLGWFTKRVVK